MTFALVISDALHSSDQAESLQCAHEDLLEPEKLQRVECNICHDSDKRQPDHVWVLRIQKWAEQRLRNFINYYRAEDNSQTEECEDHHKPVDNIEGSLLHLVIDEDVARVHEDRAKLEYISVLCEIA